MHTDGLGFEQNLASSLSLLTGRYSTKTVSAFLPLMTIDHKNDLTVIRVIEHRNKQTRPPTHPQKKKEKKTNNPPPQKKKKKNPRKNNQTATITEGSGSFQTLIVQKTKVACPGVSTGTEASHILGGILAYFVAGLLGFERSHHSPQLARHVLSQAASKVLVT